MSSLLRRLRRQQLRRVKLGTWRCRSGNAVTAFFRRDRDGFVHVDHEWSALPLSDVDVADYEQRIRPEVLRHVAEFTERPLAGTLVIAV